MSEKSYQQGKFKPKNISKYAGDPTNIIYRSSYELKMLQYCDLNESVIEYKSEEFFIPYQNPISGSIRRYFPDIFMKYKDSSGDIRKVVIEIKPQKDLVEPERNPKRKTKSWVYRVQTWAVNQAKWTAARKYCDERGFEFRIFTEKELFGHK
jgi:hypothetical protein